MHRIALKGPWQVYWLSDFVDGEAFESASIKSARSHPEREGQRVKMPASWRDVFGERAGRVSFQRRFNRPTGLTESDRVMMGFTGLGGLATVRLNGEFVGGVCQPTSSISLEITPILQPHNLLEVEIGYDPARHGPQGGLWGTVQLEIHATAE